MKALEINPDDLPSGTAKLRRDGQTVLFAVIDGKPAGLLGVADRIKSSTLEAVRLLQADGVQNVMASGDSEMTAWAVSRHLGIDEVEAGILPDQKSLFDESLMRSRRLKLRILAMPSQAVSSQQPDVGSGWDRALRRARNRQYHQLAGFQNVLVHVSYLPHPQANQ